MSSRMYLDEQPTLDQRIKQAEERAQRTVNLTLTIHEIECLGVLVYIASLTKIAQRCYPGATKTAGDLMERLNAKEEMRHE